jgi:O-antigen/teichoic acid export membrane protein
VSIGGTAKRGIAWSLSSNVAMQALQFGVGVVLARLLAPEDFGVFAITTIFTGLAATISNVGLGAALVQRREIEERHRRTMLLANLVSSSAIVLILFGLAPWVGGFFKNSLAAPVLIVSSLNFLINAVSSVSFSMMSRALRFRGLALIEAIAAVVYGAVAILLAVRGFGVWSIVWAGIAQSVARAATLLIASGWRPALGWDRAAFRQLVGFGIGLTMKRLINYGAANVDYFVIGRRLGPADLGYYTRAYGLMTLPLTQLSRVIMSVLFPTFSRIQDDNQRLIAGYSKVVTATTLLSFPFLAGLLLVAPSFISVIYGDKWLPAVLPLQIMCLAGMMKSVSTFVGSIVDAKGKVMAEVRRQLVYLVLLVGGTYLGSFYGTAGVAVAVVVASFVMLIMMQILLGKLTGMRWSTYLAALWPALAGTLVMAALVLIWQRLLLTRFPLTSPVMLVSSAAVGTAAYLLFFRLARFPRVHTLRAEIAGDLRRARSRGQPGIDLRPDLPSDSAMHSPYREPPSPDARSGEMRSSK